MKRAVVLVLAVAAATLLSPGSPRAAAWHVTPLAGYIRYEGNDVKDGLYVGGRLGMHLNKVLGIQVGGGFAPTKTDFVPEEDLTFTHFHGDLTAALMQGDTWEVFGLLGGGYSTTEPDSGDGLNMGTFDQGGGLRWWLGRGFGLTLEARNILLLDKGSASDSRINHVVYSAGLSFGSGGGKPADTDGDGIADKRDKCPDTPKGATVDAKGCPVDSDGDGVFDGLDQCAGTPKGVTVDARGCPTDSDGDGVFDGVDQCADTPRGATVDAKGCPTDSEGDGVPDGIDQCANTPKGATVDAKGCPMDSDGDGVSDGLDKCPGTAAGLKVDIEGCPIEVTEKETELLDTGMIRLQDVNFETGKSDILPESYPALDVVGAVLNKWPELRIEVGGHTDSRGSNAMNQKLSEARAQAVLNYLTQKYPGLKSEQFTVVGYGESKPLTPNTNPLNMAKNRRVEFKVLNRDVLKRESERRKMLPK